MSTLWGEAAAAEMAEAARRDAAQPPIDWSAHPPGCESDLVDVPSGRLARIAMGPVDGPRVVLVPGMTGSKEDFVLMMPLFAAVGYRVEAFDMAGQYESHGAGPENLDPPGSRYTLELFVDDLLAVLQTRPGPVHALGYSFAGTVAAVAALHRPELFSSLTLLSAPPLAGQALRGFKVLGPLSPLVPGRALGRPFIAALKHNVHRAPHDRAVFVTARFGLTRTSSVGDILALMKRTPDVAEGLRNTGIPVLVATGTGDVWQVDAHRAFAERIGARFVALRTGHSPCETAPHQLTLEMLRLAGR
ncbi:alpha/beta fold hydrolase [Microbacterium thalassium]|uniref:Pimeloyl-ACP methyl ester carboxylesterase n=1 Tax=Microbacterium thalassium TaxID=362649 RepID=A0A7X0KTX7_9MICO|nr:alpha/beta fold hydrolase [Microbacterium thalassium]MBB6390585.1 pimeloyl-ACP methyl ester carboxylesterase [Microbacterium thalassium]GLK25695.1 alpha/beta hydrolase [Microbacterium thalassium]